MERAFKTPEQFLELPIVASEELEEHYDPRTHKVFVAVTYTQLNRVRGLDFYRQSQITP